MNQYFFKMSQAERNNILDQHRSIYDGFVTQYGQTKNEQPLYVQSYANDKGGLVVSNTGNVKPYTNMKINESEFKLDQIGDSKADLKNGTVDFDDQSVMNKDYDYMSLGANIDDEEDDFYDELAHERHFSNKDSQDDLRLNFINYNKDDDEEIDFIDSADINISDEVPIDLKEDFNLKLSETLQMFNRIIK